ncbi:MAG: type I-E CRISPR-associated protein Cse1/CasA, partial [Candidatus Heritagella sp.]
MKTQEFNLLEEPWICLLEKDGSIAEVSLPEAFGRAHTVVDLAGEVPAQNVAVLRWMLAVLITVFSRVDADGTPAPLEKPRDALLRWKQLWERKQFPAPVIRNYLERWRHRFWLFDEDYPFLQVPGAKVGTQYEASKLNGELLESNHKLRHFQMRSGDPKNQLTYAEAARWILFLNGYDDSGLKAKNKSSSKEKGTDKSPGIGYLGKLGVIVAK